MALKEEDEAKALVSSELAGESLRKEVARKQELYDAVLDRLREINLVKDYGGLITDVISPVELGEKVSPKLPLVLMMGLAAGLVLGIAAAFGAEQLDPSFHTSEEVRNVLDLPILIGLPKVATVHVPSHGELKDSTIHPTLVAFHRPRSREAEAFRGLRTSLLFSSRGRRQSTIMVTSANPGDGKTLLAANLAVSIAQSGRKVLLIDGDLRRPRVHQLFGVNVDVGVSSLVCGHTDPPDAVQQTAIENLSVVTCGPIQANPAEILTAPEFEQSLQVYRQQYDFVIVDSPPLLAVSDPCIISPLVDGVIITVRINRDSRAQAIRAKELLESVNANVLGVVVNEVDVVAGDGFSFRRYGYGGYGCSNGNAYFEDSNGIVEESQPQSTNGDAYGSHKFTNGTSHLS